MAVQFGIDVAVADGFSAFRGKRVGAIVNPTSVDFRFRHLADLLDAEPAVRLSALFGPEHGVRGEAQYMVPVDDVARDGATGVPVYSLYGSSFASLTPRPEWLSGLDVLIFDVQDVGSRYYTYIYTMALAMKAAAKAGVPFVVFDRPNPLGLTHIEGNLVQPGFASFVGLYPLPTRHAMTVGELAGYLNATQGFGAALTVVPCRGLSRTMRWRDVGRAFVPPSPNMPTVDTALVYPGMCLGEGTNVSEGRGTCRPFEQFGAPWLNGREVAASLNAQQLPGVVFRPCAFTPTFDKFRGVSCEGAFLHVTDEETFLPLRTGIAVFEACRKLGRGHFAWRPDAYEFVDDVPAFDLLCGTDQVRKGYENGVSLDHLMAGFEVARASFLATRGPWLLYS
jgi:uncharacterized protein YbbC (DUF1343 family)